MILGLVSAKGSPGVTTAALALTAAAGGVFVELDPSGGSVECWTASTGEPGLIPLASGLRRTMNAAALLSHAVNVPLGVRSLLAPTSGPLAESTIAAMGDRFIEAIADHDELIVLDAGRWARSQATARRIVGCDVVAIVCRPTVEGVEAARALVEPLESFGSRVVLVLIGDRPYPPSEVAAAVGSPVAGVLEWDPRGVNALVETGIGRGWSRSALARSARSAVQTMTACTVGITPGALGV